MRRPLFLASSLVIALGVALSVLQRASNAQAPSATQPSGRITPVQIMDAFKKVSTGNLADAVEEATGQPGFMNYDMKPVFKAKMVGPASTATLRRVLKSDSRNYPNRALEVLDEAPAGNVLVYVLEDGLNIAGMGNLMATTAKVRGLAGAVIDGGVRDIEEITQIGFPVYSRSVITRDVGRAAGQCFQKRTRDLRWRARSSRRLHHGRFGWRRSGPIRSCRTGSRTDPAIR